jgi:LCP family protein required for cell wall assembly
MAVVFVFAACGLVETVGDLAEDEGGPVVLSSVDAEAPVDDAVQGELADGQALGESVTEDPTAHLKNVTIDGQDYEQKENIVNILLLGIDSDAERVKQSQGWRSDMIMLATLDKVTNKVTFTSIPRDTRAKIYKLDGNGTISSEVTEKINHAYAYGGGPSKFSAENAMRCTAELLECGGLINVPIDYYISIDLEGVPKLANEMDGVEVTLDQNVPDVGRKGETVNLKGEKTRKFLQNRYDMDDGERARQRHEQQFIRSLVRKIKDMGAAEAAPQLYDTFIKFMRTNMTVEQTVEFARVLDGSSIDDMQFNLWEEGGAEWIGGVWYYRASQNEIIHQMLDAMYDRV